jgi:SAM-dependent methyltransferase
MVSSNSWDPGMRSNDDEVVLQKELRYHEHLYAGFAQRHFSKPAVRAFRAHSAQRIIALTYAGPQTRLLSLGCGIADTELLIAPYVREVVGVDLSPAAIKQAQVDAERLAIRNARFFQGTLADVNDQLDTIIGLFFLHHLSDSALHALPQQIVDRLTPGGTFYSLDPSVSRLSGLIGRLIVPSLMKRYQTEDERELSSKEIAMLFSANAFNVRCDMYDFGSTPLAGLIPSWGMGYEIARRLDDHLLRIPFVRKWGSNFEIIAQRG